jgi:phage/plasmid primase-like uncharacterized protein
MTMQITSITSAEAFGSPSFTLGAPITLRSRRAIRTRIQPPHSLGAGAPYDPRIERARAARIEDIIAARNIKLRRSGAELIGPCPICGGDDRFSVNPKKQVFNCRGCDEGGDAIKLIQFLDHVDFLHALETLTGQMPPPRRKPNGNGAGQAAQIKTVFSEAFNYEDENGALLFQVVRFVYQNQDGSFVLTDAGKRKKTFRQR